MGFIAFIIVLAALGNFIGDLSDFIGDYKYWIGIAIAALAGYRYLRGWWDQKEEEHKKALEEEDRRRDGCSGQSQPQQEKTAGGR